MARHQDQSVREFILQNVEEHPSAVTSLAGEKFDLSRTAVSRYMARLVEDGLVIATGNTRARRYELKKISSRDFTMERRDIQSEDTVWRDRIRPLMVDVKTNIVDICQYGFTEMLNNVFDHSVSPDVLLHYAQTYTKVTINVIDHGIGIFNKIKKDFNLADERTALLELSKGKLTSDKRRHSGEGIYFTSRMFDRFTILSHPLCYQRTRSEDDDGWLIETFETTKDTKGTAVQLQISTGADWTAREVFEKYQGEDIYFRKTHVPVSLGRYPGEQLVSRSQAKRILARFTDFAEVILDFKDVEEIGQPFADEIFRVFKNEHPGTPLFAVNTNEKIEQMIRHVRANNPTSPASGENGAGAS